MGLRLDDGVEKLVDVEGDILMCLVGVHLAWVIWRCRMPWT